MKRIFPVVLSFALLAPLARASVNEALDALHDSGVALRSLAADVSLMTTDTSLGEDKTKLGRFVMQRQPDGDTRVRATFTATQSNGKTTNDKRDYLLSGTDLVDRDYSAMKQTTRQVRDPGQKVDLFKLGQGPFPLPIGQTRDDVLREFDVTEKPTKDPNALAEIELKPKANTPMAEKFKSIGVRVDRQTKLPSVITTADPNETEINTVTLTKLRINDAVSDAEFKLDPIDPSKWNLVSGK